MSIDNRHRPVRIQKAAERLAPQNTSCNKEHYGIMLAEELRDYHMRRRQSLLMEVSALEDLLKINRRCTHCGNTL